MKRGFLLCTALSTLSSAAGGIIFSVAAAVPGPDGEVPRHFSQNKPSVAAPVHSEEKRIERAMSAYLDMIPVRRIYARDYTLLGMKQAAAGRLPQASNCYLEAMRVEPGYAPAYNGLGLLMLQVGDYPAAAAFFEKYLKLRPDSVSARFNLGIALFEQGKIDDAIKAFRRVLSVSAQDFDAHYYLGRSLAARGEYHAAFNHLSQARCLQPSHPGPYEMMGELILRIDRREKEEEKTR